MSSFFRHSQEMFTLACGNVDMFSPGGQPKLHRDNAHKFD
jgi:hypothetical protein